MQIVLCFDDTDSLVCSYSLHLGGDERTKHDQNLGNFVIQIFVYDLGEKTKSTFLEWSHNESSTEQKNCFSEIF